jgi:hypothetical protein
MLPEGYPLVSHQIAERHGIIIVYPEIIGEDHHQKRTQLLAEALVELQHGQIWSAGKRK